MCKLNGNPYIFDGENGSVLSANEECIADKANDYRVIANCGGTRSGKTYSIMTMLIDIAQTTSNSIDVVSESLPHLKRGAIHDFEEIAGFGNAQFKQNLTDQYYTSPKGGTIRFFSADNWGKVKGSRRDILYINECNRIDYEIYRQLAVRTTKKIVLDWNPDSEFWFEEKGIKTQPTTAIIHSTYKDNIEHLTPQQIAEIESNKDDENWWRVYGLGLTGITKGIIYTRWKRCADVPSDATLIARGLDFGFTNDPTAIIAVYKHGGELYLDEECYMNGMTNDKIAEQLRGLDGCVVADSAEQKSIAELYNYGIKKIEPAIKGADSIRQGIQILQRYEMNVTNRSLNLIYELRNYKWREDRISGSLTNEPLDKWNHALDAVRYVALNRLAEKPHNRTTFSFGRR